MSCMTQEEKEQLVKSVADLSMRDVLTREDMVAIMKVCSEACSRRMGEIEAEIRPGSRRKQ